MTEIDIRELIQEWTTLSRSLWKKARAFSSLVAYLDESACETCIPCIIETASVRLSKSSAAFLLMALDALLAKVDSKHDLSDTLCALASVLDFELAAELKLNHLHIRFATLITARKIDDKSIKCCLFVPSSEFKAEFVTSLGKYLSELKGLPEGFDEFFPFLKTAFEAFASKPEFIEMIDRLSRRNTALAACLLKHLVNSTTIASDSYATILENLVQTDNEQVIKFMLKIAATIQVSQSLLERLHKAFKTMTPRSKEIVARFMAEMVTGKDASGPDFVEFLAKEMSVDATLTSLVQYNAAIKSPTLAAFVAIHLKASVRLNTRSAILLGLNKAGCYSFSPDNLNELFGASLLKDASSPSSLSSLAYYICAFAALVANPEFKVDAKILSETLVALGKPGGVALGCEKGWAMLDDHLISVWINQVMVPVVFASSRPELASIAVNSLVWFLSNGSKTSFDHIRLKCSALSIEMMNAICDALSKIPTLSTTAVHRVWKFLQFTANEANLSSPKLALLCHHQNLLGKGDGSWPEIVRIHVKNVDEFAATLYDQIDISTPAAEFLLISLISLSPSLVTERMNLPTSLLEAIDSLVKVSLADWNTYFATPAPVKAVPGKPAKPATNDSTAALKATIEAKVESLKKSLALTCAVAKAIPFYHTFTEMRPRIICELLNLWSYCPKLSESLPSLSDSLYCIAGESFDGQGPLLVSLFLQSSSAEEHNRAVSPSWSISNAQLLFESCVNVAKKMENDEFFVACRAFAGAWGTLDANKALISVLLEGVKNGSTAISHSVAPLLFSLFDLAVRESTLVPVITTLVIELGELEGLQLNEAYFGRLNLSLRAVNPVCRQVLLKFLVAFVYSNEAIVLPEALLRTVWLLHFDTSQLSSAPSQPMEEEDVEASEDATLSYVAEEVSSVASEVFKMQSRHFVCPSDATILGELVLLETEKGAELQLPTLVQNYIAALAELLQASKSFSAIEAEFSRLLQIRNTPNGIVRLTKNVDRSKLDFTKKTRAALLQALAVIGKSSTDPILLAEVVKFAFASGFADPEEFNCQLLFDGILAAVAATPEALYDQLQRILNAQALNDRAKVYSVIALGRAASSMALDSNRIWELIERIQESLKVPSEPVQEAVADTLVPLIKSQAGDKRVSALVSGYVQKLRDCKDDYGVIRGVAAGLAAVIQACGTGIIREHDIFALWTENLSRLSQKQSELFVCAALASIELTSLRCKIAFEPYIPPLVPGVLEALGDGRPSVRQDAESCADAMMSALSPLSVSAILPPLLEMAGADGADPRYSWRAKLGAVTWLGSMAKLAPKILTPALPKIIPALIVSLTDAHEKVHLAAHHALAVKYASIIRSPEIKAAIPAILRALSDPPKYASSCLGDIIGTSFCHAVDGPSLALLEPLLTRALRERGTGGMTEAKRRAILITANLGALMDPAELRPYLVNLIPSLRGVLGDAVPQVRAGAARALGILTKLMHNNGITSPVLEVIVPECLEIIFSSSASNSAIDRAGASLAVAQVASSGGLDSLVKLVDERVIPFLIGDQTASVTSASQEALLHLLAALPEACPKSQIPDLYRRVLSPERLMAIFEGTADEDEGVREVSSKTCRSLVLRQALLVDLQAAMSILLRASGDGRWRVRLSAFTILSDLLPALVMSEDASKCDTANRTLSLEMRSRVLSRLYFGRFDGNSHIRNTAFSLWKSIVTHPPRVIMEILPILVEDCVESLCIEEEHDDDENESEYESEDESSEEEPPVKSAASSQKSSQTPITHKLDRYEMATAALRDILVKLADRVLLPFARRLAHLFVEQPRIRPGILASASILVQVALVPSLTPPHLRTEPMTHLSVTIPRAQVDEALRLILQMTQQGLSCQDATDTVISTSVRLLDRLEKGLVGCPNLMEKIISDLLSGEAEALCAILCRRPQILLPALCTRFKKLTTNDEVDWAWWEEVLAASGPFLAPQAPSMLAHLIKLCSDTIDEQVSGVFDVLLASISTYDPDILYGDADLQGHDDEDLDELVDNGLFSFGQLLETLWSARNLRQLSAQLVCRFASQGSFGCDRFYDVWLDRLLLGAVDEASRDDCSAALEAVISGAVERAESSAVVENCLQAIDNRSSINKNLDKLPVSLVSHFVKALLLPMLSDTEGSSTAERFSAAQLLRILVASPGVSCRLPGPAIVSLLGALIRCLSDRNACTERIRAALLAIPVHLLADSSTLAGCKPFHPQLARLTVNVLKDIIGATEAAVISFDESHARGEAAVLSCRLAALLMCHMTRIEAFLEELDKFALLDPLQTEEAQIYDEASLRNARRVLLRIFSQINSAPVPAAAQFVDKTLRGFIILPSSESELVQAAASCGRDLVARSLVDASLAEYINQYI